MTKPREIEKPQATGSFGRDSAGLILPTLPPERRSRGSRECSFCPRLWKTRARFQGMTADWQTYRICHHCLRGFLRWARHTGVSVVILTQRGFPGSDGAA